MARLKIINADINVAEKIVGWKEVESKVVKKEYFNEIAVE